MNNNLLLAVFAGMLLAPALPAVDVDDTELGRARQQNFTFENNKKLPPPGEWNSTDQIRAIGARLGATIRAERPNQNITAGDKKRYLIKEIVPEKHTISELSADIIELGAQAGVDNIQNLRIIIAGYLEAAFGYNRAYADELSIYITYYNALNRGKFDELSARYSKQAAANFNKKKIGLAHSFKEWPGKTQIIVPLKDENGVPALEVIAVLEPAVVKEVEKEKPGSTVSPESIAVKEKAAAQAAAKDAEKKKESAGSGLKKTQEKEKDLSGRIQKLKEETESLQSEFLKAQKNIVKNKFGQPIQGNDGAKKIEEDLKRHKETLQKLEQEYGETLLSLKPLEQAYAEAEALAAKYEADLQRLGLQ